MVIHHQHREQFFPRVRDHGCRHRTGGCANSRAKANGSHVTTSLESVVPPDLHRDPDRLTAPPTVRGGVDGGSVAAQAAERGHSDGGIPDRVVTKGPWIAR